MHIFWNFSNITEIVECGWIETAFIWDSFELSILEALLHDTRSEEQVTSDFKDLGLLKIANSCGFETVNSIQIIRFSTVFSDSRKKKKVFVGKEQHQERGVSFFENRNKTVKNCPICTNLRLQNCKNVSLRIQVK